MRNGRKRDDALGTKGRWVGALSALALWASPWLSPRAEAQSTPEEEGSLYSDFLLVEGQLSEGGLTARRFACEGRFCLWQLSEHLGPCAGYRCVNETLVVSDREGRALRAHWPLSTFGTTFVRFLGPHQVEVVTRSNPGTNGPVPESGVDPLVITREVLKLSRDGGKFTKDAAASRPPAWKTKEREPRPQAGRGLKKPAGKAPLTSTVLARARAACLSDQTLSPRYHECREGLCMLFLSEAPRATHTGEDERDDHFCGTDLCAVVVKGNEVRRLTLHENASCVTVTPTEYVFSGDTGPYGSSEDLEWISRLKPGYMAFADTARLHLDGSEPYPVREAESVESARALAPTVHAYTVAHVTWGQKAWQGDEDLSLAWQLMRVGEELHLFAEVDDDTVVPFRAETGTGVHSDHLELTVWKQPLEEKPAPLRKLGVLLAEDGQVLVRLWTAGKDEPYAPAQGSWSRSERGYRVDLTLSLALLEELKPLVSARVTVEASDTDARGRQETLMGHKGTLRFWTEFPPSIDEHRMRTQEPQLRP